MKTNFANQLKNEILECLKLKNKIKFINEVEAKNIVKTLNEYEIKKDEASLNELVRESLRLLKEKDTFEFKKALFEYHVIGDLELPDGDARVALQNFPYPDRLEGYTSFDDYGTLKIHAAAVSDIINDIYVDLTKKGMTTPKDIEDAIQKAFSLEDRNPEGKKLFTEPRFVEKQEEVAEDKKINKVVSVEDEIKEALKEALKETMTSAAIVPPAIPEGENKGYVSPEVAKEMGVDKKKGKGKKKRANLVKKEIK